MLHLLKLTSMYKFLYSCYQTLSQHFTIQYTWHITVRSCVLWVYCWWMSLMHFFLFQPAAEWNEKHKFNLVWQYSDFFLYTIAHIWLSIQIMLRSTFFRKTIYNANLSTNQCIVQILMVKLKNLSKTYSLIMVKFYAYFGYTKHPILPFSNITYACARLTPNSEHTKHVDAAILMTYSW